MLIVFDTTPDKELKTPLSNSTMQRVKEMVKSPYRNDKEDGVDCFYRYFYKAPVKEMPCDAIIKKIIGGEFCKNKNYSSCVYFFNLSQNLLFHLYDDRGADLISPDKDTIISYYSLNDMILDYDRSEMEKGFEI